LAAEHGLGLEMMAFAMPEVMDGDWQALVEAYRPLLRNVPGQLALHGPFMDMAPASPDKRINQVTTERYQQAIRTASALGVEMVIFHANFIAAIRTIDYHVAWHHRSLGFWGALADYARQHGVVVVIENMWEYDPDILGDLIKDIAHPNLASCLDVGHAHLYGEVPFGAWLESLAPILRHTHINNNDGTIDIHMGLNHGVIDYHAMLPLLRALPKPPSMTLEMDATDFMRASLPFLELSPSVKRQIKSDYSLIPSG
jgi:sugar phosphate isomerase/epimerase